MKALTTEQKTGLKNRKLLIVAMLGCLGSAGMLATGYGLKSRQSTVDSVVETGAGIETASDPTMGIVSIAALGRLEPQGDTLELAPTQMTNSATVKEVSVRAGEPVKAGQLVAILNSYDSHQAKIKEAEQTVQIAQAELNRAQAGPSISDINAQAAVIRQLDAQNTGEINTQIIHLSQLEIEHERATEEFQRYQALFQSGAVSASQLDSHKAVMESAHKQMQIAQADFNRIRQTGVAQIQNAQANLERIVEIRPMDIAIAQSKLDVALAALARSEVELETAYVRSPIDGQVLDIHVQSGEKVGAMGIATLGKTDDMYAITEVYETDLGWVKQGQTAIIRSEYGGFEGQLNGVVEDVGKQIHRNSLFDPNPASPADVRVGKVTIRLNADSSQRVRHLTNLQVRVEIVINSAI